MTCQIVTAHCPNCGSQDRPDIITKNGKTSCCDFKIVYDPRNCTGSHANPERQLTKFTCGHIIAVEMLAGRGYCFYCGPSQSTLYDAEPIPANPAVKADAITEAPAEAPEVDPGAEVPAHVAKLTRARCVELLRADGYTGPVSYNMGKLRSLVALHTN